jgi:hypothetical protein
MKFVNYEVAISVLLGCLAVLFYGYHNLLKIIFNKKKNFTNLSIYDVIVYNYKGFQEQNSQDSRPVNENDAYKSLDSEAESENKILNSRPIQSTTSLQNKYINKFIRTKNIRGKNVISHKFWRFTEYSVAELCINFARKISKTRDAYIIFYFRNKINELISCYSKIFILEPDLVSNSKNFAILSLYLRVIQNLCFIDLSSDGGVDIFSLCKILSSEFEKFNINIKDIFNIQTEENADIFKIRRETLLSFWNPELKISNLKIQKLNKKILEI